MAERGVIVVNLRAWRQRRMLTQGELAKAAHVSAFTVSRAEKGGVTSYATLRKLATALQVAPDDLWLGRGPKIAIAG